MFCVVLEVSVCILLSPLVAYLIWPFLTCLHPPCVCLIQERPSIQLKKHQYLLKLRYLPYDHLEQKFLYHDTDQQHNGFVKKQSDCRTFTLKKKYCEKFTPTRKPLCNCDQCSYTMFDHMYSYVNMYKISLIRTYWCGFW